MNRTALTAGSLLVCLLMTLSALGGMALENDASTSVNLNESNEDTSFVVANDYWSTPVSLDSTDDVGYQSSLAIDSNDNLHVTYCDYTNGNLEYMTYDGSSWSTPVSLDSTDNVGYESSLAIDSNDNLHVTYRDNTNGNLEYMTYDGSSWSTPVSLDSTDAVGYDSSLAIDSNDNLHVTYHDNTNTNLEYMTHDGSSWSTPVSLDSTGNVGEMSSLAIDSSDNLHVTYLDITNYNLEYMTYDGSSWSTPVSIDSTDIVGWESSLAIDSNDHLHVTYYDYTNSNLEYMTYDGYMDWSTPVSLDSTDTVGYQSSLAIDSNDHLHVTYLDITNTNLEYLGNDLDGDNSADIMDACPYNYGTSIWDRAGCIDTDGDGWSDLGDDFHNKATQWRDSDGDGLGDNYADSSWNRESHWPTNIVANAYRPDANPFDFDNDGYEDEDLDDAEVGDGWDACPTLYGTSSEDRSGCIDNDGDGYSNPTSDWDEDDGADEFPGASTQWEDADDDGYGDNSEGNYPDACTSTYGTSYIDVYGCVDNDGDGYSELSDVDDDDDEESSDSDGDGYGDSSDEFPYDSSQWNDTDGDGYGDNASGNDPDAFPSDYEEWEDSDGDGYGDNEADAFPYDSTQFEDDDDDGYGDNTSGNNPDAFPNDWSQWEDSDSDGYGDNYFGNNPDNFPYDSTQWNDSDDDGYGDNATGNNPDAFPYDDSQFEDSDGDGYGDNEDGNDPDMFPYDSTQFEDSDNDGYGDNTTGNNPDEFPYNSGEWADTDGDGYGDNYEDHCPYVSGNVSMSMYQGCPDSDGDTYADLEDAFDNDDTQWSDYDGDGYGDNSSGTTPDFCLGTAGTSTMSIIYNFTSGMSENVTAYGCPDSDSDGYENQNDPCPYTYGNSWVDEFGCADTDQDGISDFSDPYPNVATDDIEDWDNDSYADHAPDNNDNIDAFPDDSTQWSDTDWDMYGDNPNGTDPDVFPLDSTQWKDSDGDGYGDNYDGNNSDSCIYSSGNSTLDRFGCADSDGDGISNPDGEWSVYDGADAFISDITQWEDEDGDGYGDNLSGTTPDSCFDVAGSSTMSVEYNFTSGESVAVVSYGCPDSDSDGYDDGSDPCPYSYGNSWVDSFGCPDADQDGISDFSDPYPNLATDDIEDWDNDSYLDNAANDLDNTDDFPDDSTQWLDYDYDGYGDNLNGSEPDAFPLDGSQWSDVDGDGYGDNYFGNNHDDCVNTNGTSTIDRFGCSDSDSDGVSNPDGDWSVSNGADAFISDITQWSDQDGDGYGDNQAGTTPDSCVSEAGSSTLSAHYNNSNGQWSNMTEYGCLDEDGDGYDDFTDPCPFSYGNSWVDQLACPDTDQDGVSDLNDPLPQNPSTSSIDWDGDGVTDHSFNQSLNIDQFPEDPTQWTDTDNDGRGDNMSGNEPDAFPNEPSQWQDTDGDGYGDNQNGYNSDQCRFTSGNSTMPFFGCLDSDGDEWADEHDAFEDDDTQWRDMDGDGYGDEMNGNTPDQCSNQPGTSTLRVGQGGTNVTFYGCEDRDNDGYEDQTDPCPNQYGTSWVDQLACIDDDGDGISNAEDPEPFTATTDIEDWDGDGYLDHADNELLNTDDFPADSSQWVDSDGDGYGDNLNGNEPDIFPNEGTQWMDSDGDGYGDNNEVWAYNPDACTFDNGNSTLDRNGCIDSDGDGYSDASSTWLAYPYGPADSLPYDSTQWEDLDGDGCGDEYQFIIDDETGLRNETGDAFPKDAEQCSDEDGDGFGEEEDAFPEDETEWIDADGDGVGFNSDWDDLDRTQSIDSDGDGYGDDQDGRDADVFPNDPLQWRDSDYDGYGDNNDEDNGDQFPRDPTQWNDTDMDGHGDNLWGNNPDAFINDNEEWEDLDGDRLGDNKADQCYDIDSGELRMCIFDADNDGFDDDEDQFPDEKTQWIDEDLDGKGDNCRFYEIREGVYGSDNVEYLNINATTAFNGDCSLNDRDNDGRKDPSNPIYTDTNQIQIKKESLICVTLGTTEKCEDAFPDDPNEWADNDEDGTGDNADQDDDNDGVSDKVEEDSGTDSFSSASKPFAGVDIPVIDINLQEWDLITIGIGGPSALYLAFTFLSRNKRTEEFEELIHIAKSEIELQTISDRYERALQMRLIGAHQGLRLERIRSKRENILEYDMVEQHNMEVDLLPKQVEEIPSSEEE